MRLLRLPLMGVLFLSLWGINIPADAATQAQGPVELVKDTTDKMMAKLRAEHDRLKAQPKHIYDLVYEIVLPHFDFVRISRWVLGKHWRTASKEQKLRFIRAFRNLMVRTYAMTLLEYDDQQIRYLPLRGDPASGDVTVHTQILERGRQPIKLNYRLFFHQGRWRAYDVTVEGVSLASTYRTSFATDIRKDGLDALIERMEKHNINVKVTIGNGK